MKKPKKNSLKLVSMVSLLIFSLFALGLGAFAWFTSTLQSTLGSEDFSVTTAGDCELVSAKLYKFIYPDSEIGEGYDYLRPQEGTVSKYDFNEEQNHFGYYDEHSVWVNVYSMNIFDPVEMIISRTSTLRDLHCNAIYEVTIHSGAFDTTTLNVNALLKTGITLNTNEMLLSDCVDFDVYFDADLSDTNPLFYDEESGNYDKYYPTYKDTLSALEKDYHKISYLSSLVAQNAHKNFYSTNPKSSSIQLKQSEIAMDSSGNFKIYINANYAPKQLESLSRDLYLNNIQAIYDFGFEISLGNGGNE